MLTKSIPNHRKIGVILGLLLFAILMAMGIQCAQESNGRDGLSPGLGMEMLSYDGPVSLEERILRMDVIVKATLQGVTAGTGQHEVYVGKPAVHVGTLVHSFTVSEYLKGTGDAQITAIVWEIPKDTNQTQVEAAARGQALLAERDTQWDNREAVVFLWDMLSQPNRYVLGGISATPWEADALRDGYTLASRLSKNWLPSTAGSGARGASKHRGQPRGMSQSTGDNVSFYLEPPTRGGAQGQGGYGAQSGPSGQSGGSSTITLTAFKNKIAALNQEIADGDGITGYEDCIRMKYSVAREWDYQTDGGTDIFLHVDEGSLESGLAAGTLVWASPDLPLTAQVPVAPVEWSPEYELLDNDAHLFYAKHPGLIYTARPLPAGEYKFYFNQEARGFVVCNGQPASQKRDFEIQITSLAPNDAVHEAFFDPAGVPYGMGFSADGGVLEPSRFTTFNTDTEITSLVATGDLVTMGLSPYVDLTFDTLDFIGLDGSLAVSLSDGTGDATAGTITWEATAPWSSGDQLMLRIVEGEGRPVPKLIASEVAPRPEVFFVIPSIGARLHWEAMDDLEGESVTGYTLQWAYEEDGIWLPATCSNSDQLQCWARWRDNDFGRGDTVYFRVIAHSETYDSMPSPVFEFTSR